MSEYSDWRCYACLRAERVMGPITSSRSCICGTLGGMSLVAAYRSSAPQWIDPVSEADFVGVAGKRVADELAARIESPCKCSTRQLMGYFGAVGGGGCPRKRGGLSCYVL